MSATNQLLDQARERHQVSDWKLAQLMGVVPSAIKNWRAGRNYPDDLAAVRLAELAGVDQAVAVARIHAERAKGDQARDLWQGIADRLSKVAACVVAAVILAAGDMPENANADNGLESSTPGQRAIHYRAVRSWLKRALRGLAYQLRQVFDLAESRNLREC